MEEHVQGNPKAQETISYWWGITTIGFYTLVAFVILNIDYRHQKY
ncbi:hypothetical protein SLEP1_g57863 [Rubroshorea leprosula]|uniref:Uncharacterized protein n=1 Tax=Rubroshorea leprosula TaxID=152421 RepID=A0AAV5MS15_9ROSI|nr:hypothetical protein SLEP1_g57863 [Rubroshorea leprosula]